MAKISTVMVKDVVTIDPGTSLIAAADRMREANVGMLPIVEDGQLRAVLTDRDLVVRAITRNADLAGTPAIECATEEPTAARTDWDVEDALEVMARDQVGRLPVVDEDDRLVGVVTLSSLVLRGGQDRAALEAAKRAHRRKARAKTAPRRLKRAS